MERPFELFLALRILRPKRSYVSVITILSLLGVILGVAVLIVVLAVMEGFEKELRDKVIGFNAHLTVTNFGVLKDIPQILERLHQDPDVVEATPFVLGPVLAEFNKKITTPYIKGVYPDEISKVLPIQGAIVAGDFDLGPESIVVGDEWARRNGAWIGDTVYIHSPRNLESYRNRMEGKANTGDKSVYLPSEYKITGIFSTGFFDYDYNFLLINLNEARRLYSLDQGAHGIAVKLKDPYLAFALKEKLNKEFAKPLQALTWMDQNKRLFGAVAVERRVMFFLLFFVMIVAAFGLSSTLITITVQKAKEIGVLKAIGARSTQILTVFTLYGFIVGVVGAVLGAGLGIMILAFRNEFSRWLLDTFNYEVFPAEIYSFSAIPAVIDWQTIFFIALSGVVLSTLAAFLPALIAARVDPVKTLHAE